MATIQELKEMSIYDMGQFFEQSIISHISDEMAIKKAEDAVKYNMAGLYAPPNLFEIVKPIIEGTGLWLGSGVSFPMGDDFPDIKAFAAEKLFERGATNIDFVMNHGALREGRKNFVEEEVKLIRKAVPDAVLKMIIEVCVLTDDQIDYACDVAIENGIDFVKTSTGQMAGPKFDQMIRVVDKMHAAGLGAKVAGVKAPHPQNAMVTLMAGVDRIGTQNAALILDGFQLLRERGLL
ncbi:MAG: deoxyribose-phosphate aldolase [Lachnospiraceae bacterium]|nr:deoxyribose-phosphate aldolase [Lachnospiraceae bacterium]